jgi:hypothetical protein
MAMQRDHGGKFFSDTDAGNDHIDVCQCCGRYYGYSPMLEAFWRQHYHPRPGEVMPQLCGKCMRMEVPL